MYIYIYIFIYFLLEEQTERNSHRLGHVNSEIMEETELQQVSSGNVDQLCQIFRLLTISEGLLGTMAFVTFGIAGFMD
jgi:hypothetical protein